MRGRLDPAELRRAANANLVALRSGEARWQRERYAAAKKEAVLREREYKRAERARLKMLRDEFRAVDKEWRRLLRRMDKHPEERGWLEELDIRRDQLARDLGLFR